MKKKEEKNTTPVSSDDMTDELMRTLLVELSHTRYYQAIVWLYNSKEAHAIQSLSTIDPFKDPTSIAKIQGIRIGLHYISNEIEEEVKRREEIESGPKEDTSIPSYNT